MILLPIIGLAISCTQEDVVPANGSLPEGENRRGLTPSCETASTRVWADQQWVDQIDIDAYQDKRFYTNEVCGATSYTWTVDKQASITTSTPYIDLRGRDLVWRPAGGCEDFNKKWTSSNPLFDPKFVDTWKENYGSIPTGFYSSEIKVKANTSATSISLPVVVSNIQPCFEMEIGDGIPTPPGGGSGDGGGGIGG